MMASAWCDDCPFSIECESDEQAMEAAAVHHMFEPTHHAFAGGVL